MITSITAKLLKLTSPSTNSSYYLKDRKQVWDYDPLDKTSPASDTVLIGYGGKRFKLAGSLAQPPIVVEPPIDPPVVIEPPVIIPPIIIPNYPFFTETPNAEPTLTSVDGVTQYGIRAGIDNTAALMRFNQDFFGKNVLLDLSKTQGRLQYSNNMWIVGINALKVIAPGIEFQCTTTAPQHYYQGPFFPGTIYTPWPQGLGTGVFKGWNTGQRIKTVSAGSKSIMLIDAGNYAAGDRIFIQGYESQFYGWPPNPRFFEWNTIESIIGTTINLKNPLRFNYNEQWKDVKGFFADAQAWAMLGKPRVFKLTNYASYVKIIGASFLAGSNQPSWWENGGYFPGDTVLFEDCNFERITLWPSENRYIKYTRCTATSTDLDKDVGTCIFDTCAFKGGIDAATGIQALIILNSVSEKRAAVSPQNIYAENSTFKTVDGQPSLFGHWEGTHINKVYLKNCVTNGVMFSGIWNDPNPREFTPIGVTTNTLTYADTWTGNDANGNLAVLPVKAIGFGSTIWTKDGLTKATVKDIIHDGTNYVFLLENIQGVIKAGQVWMYKQTDQVIDLGGNKNGSGQAISIK